MNEDKRRILSALGDHVEIQLRSAAACGLSPGCMAVDWMAIALAQPEWAAAIVQATITTEAHRATTGDLARTIAYGIPVEVRS